MRYMLILTAALALAATPARAQQQVVPAPQPVPNAPAESPQSGPAAPPALPEPDPAQSGRTLREQPAVPFPTQPIPPTDPVQPQ